MKANNMAKRCFSALLALSLAAGLMLSACSENGGNGAKDAPDVLTFTVPETFTSGCAGQFEVTVKGLSGQYLDITPGIGAEMVIQSTDERFYSLGESFWEEGKFVQGRGEQDVLGTVEREEDGGWTACGSISNWTPKSMTLIKTEFDLPPMIHSGFVHPYETNENEQVLAMSLDDYLPGHYRARITVREYLPLWTEDTSPYKPVNGEDVIAYGGSNSETEDEIVLEFDIPAHGDEPVSVMEYKLIDHSREDEDGSVQNIAELDLLFYANGDIRYPQADTLKLEREENGVYVTVEDGTDDFWTAVQYRQWCRIAEDDGEPEPRIVPVSHIVLQNWDREGTYRFSLTFSASEDGSSERYTVLLPLKFAETAS